MLRLLSEMGRSFLRAFVGSLIVLLPGMLAAPNLTGAVALGIAALIASLAAGLKAVQVFVPQLSFRSILKGKLAPYYTWVDSFARAFVAALITSVLGLLAMPTESWSKALLIAALTGAVTAGIRAVQGFLTPGDVPVPASGVTVPAEKTNPGA